MTKDVLLLSAHSPPHRYNNHTMTKNTTAHVANIKNSHNHTSSKTLLVNGFLSPGSLIFSFLTWLEAQPGLHLFLDSSVPSVTKNLRLTGRMMTLMVLMVIMMMKRRIKDQGPQVGYDQNQHQHFHPPEFTPYPKILSAPDVCLRWRV